MIALTCSGPATLGLVAGCMESGELFSSVMLICFGGNSSFQSHGGGPTAGTSDLRPPTLLFCRVTSHHGIAAQSPLLLCAQ